MKFSIDNVRIYLALHEDKTLQLTLDLEAITLEDARIKTDNKFKKILSAYPAGLSSVSSPDTQRNSSQLVVDTPLLDLSNQISIKLELNPQEGMLMISLRLSRPRIFVVPSHLLAIFVRSPFNFSLGWETYNINVSLTYFPI